VLTITAATVKFGPSKFLPSFIWTVFLSSGAREK